MQLDEFANQLYSRSELLISNLDSINEKIDDFATKIELADERLEMLRLQTPNLTIIRADRAQLTKISRKQDAAMSVSLMVNCFLFIAIVFVFYVISEGVNGNFL
ncbi:hypothetical protein SS50377_21795 [Spironucleus salmonicida]|uniref:Uncharacterized protein n=1 Tax=Spironucleus salmonicida TaxID=348837 RepID=V6LP13_9EUKA|nr:hypothetical protein SS50377_21795 [Spironucleus salmonicida]|eukprot:EST45456.1 Hypothetical protein SS50377_14610 [Spironucleus salmonicida]